MQQETDFLDDMTEEAPAPEAAPEPAASPATSEGGVVRDDKGRFARPSEAGDKTLQAPDGAPQEPGPPPEHEERGQLAALKAEREKRQAAEAELAKLRSAQQPQPEGLEFGVPSLDFDPDDQIAAYIKPHLLANKLQLSRFMALQQNDPQEVAEAWAAFDQAASADPLVSQLSYQLQNHPHPIGEVVKWYRQQRDLRRISESGGLDAYVEKLLAERLAATGAAPAGSAPPGRPAPVAKPGPSLANGGAGGARGPQSTSEDDEFEAFFNKKR